MMLPPVYETLIADSSMTLLVGDEIYRHDDAPQGVGKPYIAWSTSIAPENTLSELPGIDRHTVTINCYSKDDAEVAQIAQAVRDAMEPVAHFISMPVNNRDRGGTNLYRMALQFDWWLVRNP